MRLRDTLSSSSGGESRQEAPRQLAASDKDILGRQVDSLKPGQSGWIAFEDHDRLFATTHVKSGPHLWDDAGLEALESFAAEHDSSFRTLDAEHRVSFTRNVKEDGQRRPMGKGPKPIGWETYIGISILSGMLAYFLLSGGSPE